MGETEGSRGSAVEVDDSGGVEAVTVLKLGERLFLKRTSSGDGDGEGVCRGLVVDADEDSGDADIDGAHP